MKDQNKTKRHLINELEELRQRLGELEKSEVQHNRTQKAFQLSEEAYSTTLDAMADAIHVVDSDLRFTLFNKAFREWNKELGLDSEVIGRNIFEVFPFLDDDILDEYQSVINSGNILTTEESNVVNGKEIITETRKIPISTDGRTNRVVTVIRDITGNQKAQKALERSEKKYRLIFDLSPEAIVLLDRQGTVLDVNGRVYDWLGYKPKEIIGKHITELPTLPEESKAKALKKLSLRIAGEELPPYELDFVKKNGEKSVGRVVASPVKDSEGRIIQDIVMIADVTEIKRAEEALRESEILLRTAIDSLPFDFFVIGTDGYYVMQNSACKERWGDVIGKRPEDLGVDRDVLALWQDNNSRALAGEIVQGEVQFPVGGQQRFYYNIIAPIRDGEQIQGIFGTNIDITERRLAEEALRESEERYGSLFKNNHSVMLLIDPESGDIVDANPAACSFYGWNHEELTGKKITDINMLTNEEVFQEMQRAKSAQRQHFFFRHRLASEEVRHVEVYSGPIMLHGKQLLYSIIHDISERKRVEETLRKEEEKYRILVEESPLGVSVIAEDGSYQYINPKFVEIFGYSLTDILTGQKWFRKAYPDEAYRKEVISVWIDDLKKSKRGEVRPRTYVVTCKDGSEKVIYFRPVTMATGDQFVIYEDVTEQRRAEEALRQSEIELLEKSRHLEEVNAALKVLLKRREDDKVELEENLLTNVKELILPYLEKLKKSQLDPHQTTLVSILDSHITDIVSPFLTKLSSRFFNLTPAEIQVASLISGGKTNKEIADLLHLSVNTIRSHRFHIRTKLGLKNKKINLRTYLRSLQKE